MGSQPGLTMDYPCGLFGGCSFGSLVLSCRQTHRHTHRRGWTLYSGGCRWRE